MGNGQAFVGPAASVILVALFPVNQHVVGRGAGQFTRVKAQHEADKIVVTRGVDRDLALDVAGDADVAVKDSWVAVDALIDGFATGGHRPDAGTGAEILLRPGAQIHSAGIQNRCYVVDDDGRRVQVRAATGIADANIDREISVIGKDGGANRSGRVGDLVAAVVVQVEFVGQAAGRGVWIGGGDRDRRAVAFVNRSGIRNRRDNRRHVRRLADVHKAAIDAGREVEIVIAGIRIAELKGDAAG